MTHRRRQILTGRRPTKKRDYSGPNGVGPNGVGPNYVKAAGAKKGRHSVLPSAIVPTFMHMLNTVKLYHWKTTSFSTHKATDELYGELNELLDKFVEVMLGKREMGGRAKLLNVPMIKLGIYSNNEAFQKQIENYKHFLLALNNDMGPDLLAIRDEILAAFNKFLYLLTLA
jgi:hypothetical protein